MPRKRNTILLLLSLSIILPLAVSLIPNTPPKFNTRFSSSSLKMTSKQAIATETSSSSTVFSTPPKILPKLLVFDLDNTIWTPELYQIRMSTTPQANEDIRLFSDAELILSDLSTNPLWNDVQFAVASRTHQTKWAQSLLQQFKINKHHQSTTLSELFPHQQIVRGSKLRHFENLARDTGFQFRDMIFFDDDARMNLREVERMGVLCCHTPRGLSLELFQHALWKYSEMKERDSRTWMGMTLDSKSLGLSSGGGEEESKIATGKVKFYSSAKRFGFVVDEEKQDYFVHESKIPKGLRIKKGMSVQFQTMVDGKGRPAAAILASLDDIVAPDNNEEEKTVELMCFSMSQPFAALLLNGVKTIETRNNPMFQNIKPGTKVLLHCGMRDWKDLDDPQNQLQKAGYSQEEIRKLSKLPKGFQKGNIIGIVEVGRTWLSTERERRGENMQKKSVARFENIGKYCMEIRDVRWLKKGVRRRGNVGVYNVSMPKECLPEGWDK